MGTGAFRRRDRQSRRGDCPSDEAAASRYGDARNPDQPLRGALRDHPGGADRSALPSSAADLRFHVWRGGGKPGAQDASHGRRLRGGRDRSQDPAFSVGRHLPRRFPRKGPHAPPARGHARVRRPPAEHRRLRSRPARGAVSNRHGASASYGKDALTGPMPNLTAELQRKAIDTIRFLAVDAVENANSGHPGLPMGAAPMAFVLWSRHLRFNPNDPRWPGRDRFILSAGHGSMLLYALLHLAGFKVSLDDLKKFRQLHSNTPGHPEFGDTDGVEATTGPLGQGIANAVGFALSQKMLAARLGEGVLDATVYGICSDGDLMEGVASEACSLAGHLGLGNLVFLYDDNHVSLAGHTEVTFSEDRNARFAAYGWHTLRVEDGNDVEAIDRAIATARGVKDRPSLISVRTILGYGAPTKANTHEAHGSPLGKDEVRRAKENLGWPLEPPFFVPDEVRAFWAGRIEELKKDYEAWQKRFAQWRSGNPDKARVFDQLATRAVPGNLADELVKVVSSVKESDSTRKIASSVLQKAAELVPSLVGGSADLDPSTLTYLKNAGDVGRGQFGGRNIHFGVREHGMGAIVNGFAYDGFFLPYGATFLLFSDYMRPPIRLAALSGLQSLFVYTHDSIFLGEDGPTHQPIEQLASLRAVPNLHVWRPGDPLEVAAPWTAALPRKNGPSV